VEVSTAVPPPDPKWDRRHQPPPSRTPRRVAPDPDRQFRRTVVLTIVGTILPGIGLIAARRHLAGLTIFGIFLSAILSLGIYASVDRQALLALAVNPEVLRGIGIALVAVGLIWVGVIIATHLALRGRVSQTQRAAGGILVGILAFAVVAPMAVASIYSYEQASLVGTVFKSEKKSKSATRPTLTQPTRAGEPTSDDPWADKPRLNLLLLGGDAGRGRSGTRTDSVILASINTRTGDTTLFSLPRNTARMPFPSDSPLSEYYPYGFTDGDSNNAEYFLNAMYQNVPNTVPKDVLGETDNLGADALKLSVGEALGLKIDYYLLINLQGFGKLINALGGIRVNVNTYVAIGGNKDRGILPDDQITPGPNKHLDGAEALWFARGRYGSDDYQRMDRQRCVLDAIVQAADPVTLLSSYRELAATTQDIVSTDVPSNVLGDVVDLALRVKDSEIRSVVFDNTVIDPAYPDYDRMRALVQEALAAPAPVDDADDTAPSGTPAPSTSPAPSPEPAPTEGAGAASEVGDACAFDPAAAAEALAAGKPPTRGG
jgi:LCP family protein required for cell wall assembly